jgi:MFS family permease
VPFKALRLGADPLALGGLAAASTGTYALLAVLFGRLSDRVPRMQLARASCVGLVVACIGLTVATRVSHLLLCIPLVGGSLSLFWPSVQASVADRSDLQQLQTHLGRFNLSWSTGKGTGFLLGGLLVTTFGAASTFTVAACIAFVIFVLLPQSGAEAHGGPIDALLHRSTAGAEIDAEMSSTAAALHAAAGDAPPASPSGVSSATEATAWLADVAAPSAPETAADVAELDARAPLFRRLAWAANCAAFGLGATLTYHYPRVVQERGWSPRTFGLFLGFVYLTQTLTFAILMLRPEAWRFRRLRLYLPQLVMLFGALSLPFADRGRLLITAVVFGIGLGICYYSSIYYSLHTHTRRGRNAGVHETLIGLGSMLVPLLGGILARQLDSLWTPYLVAAGGIALSLVVQEALYRAGSAAANA